MRKTLLLFITVLSTLFSIAQPHGQAGEITKVPTGTTPGQPFGYVEYLPTGYNGTTKYPLIISFVGKGEFGNGSINDLDRVVSKPPINVMKSKAADGAIVVAPQKSTSLSSTDTKLIYDWAVANYAVDINRVYITGFSFGGATVWSFANDYPDLVAAIIPICGAGSVNKSGAPYLQTMPCWSHHNFDDGAVNFAFTADNFKYISGKAQLKPMYPSGIYPYINGNTSAPALDNYTMYMDLNVILGDTIVTMSGEYGVKEPKQYHAFTVYTDGGHNAWDKTLQNPDVWTWLLKQSKAGVITSTKKLTAVTVEIYPNPSSSKIEVKIPTDLVQSVTSINISNMNGAVVKSMTNNITSNVSFNVSALTSGVYTLTINTSTDTLTRKVIIE